MTPEPHLGAVRPRLAVLVGVAGVLAAWLAFGFFEVQALFVDEVVSEPPPSAPAPAPAADPPAPTPSPPDDEADQPEPAATPPSDATAPPEPPATDPPTPEPAAAEPEPLMLRGAFVSRAHRTEGQALVTSDGSRRYLRLENFRTDNGPDVNVYLSTAPADAPGGAFADDFVDLGDLKGNVGDQNYELPDDVDLERYATVVIWCVRFSVVFGAAELS